MSAIFTLLLIAIFAACVGVLYPEGLWSNAIRLINVTTAALLATNYFEPLARWFEDKMPSATYFWDFIAIWAVFCIALVLLRLATDSVSRVKVRFLKIVDRVGGAAFGAAVGWVMVCFVTMSINTAPLGTTAFGGGFDPSQRMFLGLAPDRQWLSFAQHVSAGCFAQSDPNVFDPDNKFLVKYHNRRGALEKNRTEKKAFLVDASSVPKR